MGRLQRRSSQAHGALVRPPPLSGELGLAPVDDPAPEAAGRSASLRRLPRQGRLRRVAGLGREPDPRYYPRRGGVRRLGRRLGLARRPDAAPPRGGRGGPSALSSPLRDGLLG